MVFSLCAIIAANIVMVTYQLVKGRQKLKSDCRSMSLFRAEVKAIREAELMDR